MVAYDVIQRHDGATRQLHAASEWWAARGAGPLMIRGRRLLYTVMHSRFSYGITLPLAFQLVVSVRKSAHMVVTPSLIQHVVGVMLA
jgi:hypothetical protein